MAQKVDEDYDKQLESEKFAVSEIQLPESDTTPWVPDVYLPLKGKFRPVYINIMLRLSDSLTNGMTFDDIVSERHFGTYFVTPVFSESTDLKYVTDILVPYLREVAKQKRVSWNVNATSKKGRLGVIIPGRLAASLLQGMLSSRPPVPFLWSFLFMEEL